jgi:excisionase family DNA binding protein
VANSQRTISEAKLAEMMARPGRLLTVRQVAEVLSVAPFTVYRLAKGGELRHVRVSNALRFEPADLAAFVASRRQGGRS